MPQPRRSAPALAPLGASTAGGPHARVLPRALARAHVLVVSLVLVPTFVLTLVLASGCAPVQVTTRVEPDADFSRYASFAPPASAWEHPLVGPSVEGAITAVLVEKGYTLAPDGDADLAVTYRASGERVPRRVNAGEPDTEVYVVEDYLEKTFEIEVYDVRSRERVWEGVGVVDFAPAGDPRAAATQLRAAAVEAVEAVLAKFPARLDAAE